MIKIALISAKLLCSITLTDLAITLLRVLLKSHPTHSELIITLGGFYAASGQHELAERLLLDAMRNSPDDLWLREVLGYYYFSSGRYHRALTQFKYLLEHYPSSTDRSIISSQQALQAQCMLYISNDTNTRKIESLINLALEPTPWNLDALQAQILFYRRSGQSRLIPKTLRRYIERYPAVYPPYFWLASYIHYSLRSPNAAVEYYRLAYERYRDPKIHKYCDKFGSSRALVFSIIGEYLECLASLSFDAEALTVLSNSERMRIGGRTRLHRIDYLIAKGDYDKAEKMLLTELRKNNNTARVLTFYAMLCKKRKDYEHASQHISKALAIDDQLLFALEILSEVQMEQQQWVPAIDTINSAIKLDRISPDLLANLGKCFAQILDLSNAISAYEKSIFMDPLNLDALHELGSLYVQVDRKGLAKSLYLAALSNDDFSVEQKEEIRTRMSGIDEN